MATRNESNLHVSVTGDDQLSPKLQKLESQVIRTVGAISAALAAIQIGTAPIRAAATFQRELADVEKTTGFAAGEMEKLADSIQRMSLRVNVGANDLAKIAAAAGQQGLGRYGVEGVTQFTDSVARMASVLDLTAEDAATQVGKILNIFRIPLNRVEDAVSTFNEVSNNSTASGEDLLDVVRRIGDAAGSLNLQQATALAATGLDFGQSAEVVGTAFAKVFSALFEDADKFGKLLNVNTESWIQMVQTDGLAAFKKVLDGLRGLKPQDQQRAIVELFGGGRIGSLINKLVQDTSNTVLERNFASAIEGASGNSAIKEQETILKTFIAQLEILRNSISRVAATSSDALLRPLTGYAAQLSAFFSDPATERFFTVAMEAVGDFVGSLASAVKWVASLNINWENFLTLVRVFLSLKLVELVAGWAYQFSVFGVSLKSISTASTKAADDVKKIGTAAQQSAQQQAAASAATKQGLLATIVGYGEALAALNAYKAAQQGVAEAERDLQRAREARNAARAPGPLNDVVTQRTQRTEAASQGVSAASSRYRQAQEAEESARIAAQKALAQRIEQADQESAARRLAIEQSFEQRKAAIKATGTRVGLTAAVRERDQLLAEEERRHARSLRSIESYHARRAAMQAAALAAQTTAEKAALAQQLALFDTQSQKLAASVARRDTVQAAQDAAAQQVNVASRAVAAQQAVLAAASIAWKNFGLAVRTTANVIAFAGRLILAAFSWATILYSIADATGLLDKMWPVINKVGEFLGFTSKAKRDAAIAAEAHAKALEKERQALEDQIDAVDKYRNKATGQIDQTQVDRLVTLATQGETRGAREDAEAELNKIIGAAAAQKRVAEEFTNKAILDAIAEQERAKADAENRIAAQRQRLATQGDLLPDATKTGIERGIAALSTEIDKANRKITELRKGMTLGAEGGKLKQDVEAVSKSLASFYTPQTRQALEDYILQIAKINEQNRDLRKEQLAAQQTAKTGFGQSGKAAVEAEQASQRATEIQATINANNTRLTELSKALEEYRKKALEVAGNNPTLIKAFDDLATKLNAPVSTVLALVEALKLIDPSLLTGKNAGVTAAPAPDGDTKLPPKNEESIARRTARIRLNTKRALAQEEANLEEEKNRQIQDAEQRAYDIGLRSMSEYFSTRRRLEEAAVDNEVAAKRREIEAVEFELKGAKDSVERTRFEGDRARLNAEIKTLQERRKGIAAATEAEAAAARKSFNERVANETNSLMQSGVLPGNTSDLFAAELNVLYLRYEDFLNKLRTEGKDDLADAIISGLQSEALLSALRKPLTEVQLMFGQLENAQQRLTLAQQNGVLTTNQLDRANTALVQHARQGIQQQIVLVQNLLRAETDKNSKVSLAYRQQLAELDSLLLKLDQMEQQTNQTARSINSMIKDELTDALAELEPTFESLEQMVLGFIQNIANNLQRMFAQDIAEGIMNSLGSGGDGGIGGWIEGFFGSSGGGKRDGSSKAKALYVTTSGEDLLSGPELSDNGPLWGEAENDLGAGIKGQIQSMIDGLGDLFNGLFDNLSGIFDSLTDSLGSFFSNLGGGGGGGIFDAIMSVFQFHNGGKVGNGGSLRKVNPAVFQNAIRAHSGLRPDEIPAILQTGERVLNRQENKAYENGMGAGVGELAIRNVLVMDPDMVTDAMNSSQGERITMTHLKKNAATARQILGIG